MKVFWSDNGGEFVNGAFTKALQDAGIKCQLSVPYAHQQNGKAKWAIQTIGGRLFTMLKAARLPANLWGEAALMVCYLWNRSTSRTLPPNTTPFELMNGCKPNLSHIQVFGSHCFARIPTELQVKLGPRSRPATFLGYPKGTKGYCLCDKVTGAFFVARDIIFDEHPAYVPRHEDDSDSDDAEAAPASPIPRILPSPLQVLSPSLTVAVWRSTRTRTPTPAGQAWEADMTATKACLLALRDSCAARVALPALSSKGVIGAEVEKAGEEAGEENLEEIEPNTDIPEVFANVMIEEHAHISIRSDRKRNPNDSDYDMAIPPATYEEAMLRTD